jgi:hypothetical protein
MKTFSVSILFACVVLFSTPVQAQQFKQQGPKLVGHGAIGNAFQGGCVALSADGNTALSSGSQDNGDQSGGIGATWVWVRSNGIWRQQEKLVGAGGIGLTDQGAGCALSADGNTAVVGGPGDGSGVGAVWVFTRRDGVWSQQGPKLVGTGAVGGALQGFFVDVSADGNTLIEGGFGDNPTGSNGAGAAWVFTRGGGVWTQQGPKLVGSGASGPASQGISVALSGDGNTAMVGGYTDDNGQGASGQGAVWVWTRHEGVWTQQGPKLVGSGASGGNPPETYQGLSVALSYDGNRALVGGPGDGNLLGAVWAWNRQNGVWTQNGPKLVGSGAEGHSYQGGAISMSADGNKAIIGGQWDASNKGAVWIWAYKNGVWTQQGRKFTDAGTPNPLIGFGFSVAMSKATGTTVIVGGPYNNNLVGAAWVSVQ